MIKQEVPISEALLKQVLTSLSSDSVLVGGQALAYWVSYYAVELPSTVIGAISDDADVLGSRRDVLAIAQQTHGRSELQPQGSLSALIGHITIPVSETTFVNVDVLHRLVGIKADQVRVTFRRKSTAIDHSQGKKLSFTCGRMKKISILSFLTIGSEYLKRLVQR